MSDPDRSTADNLPTSTRTVPDVAVNNYAFLVHSEKTLTQNLPPKIDNKLLARQKRRRTSPEEHAILEAEYKRNPKPDKKTRANIVNRVAMGEKEIQIWFQNRRQSDRRKSKPLDPPEFLAGRTAVLYRDDPTATNELKDSKYLDNVRPSKRDQMDKAHSKAAPVLDVSPSSSFEPSATPKGSEVISPGHIPSSQTTIASNQPDLPGDLDVENHRPVDRALQTASKRIGLSNVCAKRKRSTSDLKAIGAECADIGRGDGLVASSTTLRPSLRISLSFDGEAMVRKEDEKTPSPPKPRDSVRISMSADGEALIRTGNEASPSSIKDRIGLRHTGWGRLGSLRRTSSAITLGATNRGTEHMGKAFGRSRNARTWELYCDTDARSALSTPSILIQGGSGTGSIGPSRFQNNKLHRRKSESSSRNILTPRSDLLNALDVSKQHQEQKRKKLSRVASSLARLQSDRNFHGTALSARELKDLEGLTSNKIGKDVEFHCGDSDKENWIPGTQTSYSRRRGSSRRKTRAILETSHNPGHDTSRGRSAVVNSKLARNSQSQPAGANKENREHVPDGQDDEEITTVMTGSSGPSQEDDLYCIQGLLSLSQGAWR